jgi:capsular polysaccharide biosynthesis protein
MNNEIYSKRTEVRRHPRNLQQKDIKLFEHELRLELPPVILAEFKNVQVLRNLIFSLKEFRFHLLFTHIFDVPRKYLLKRMLMLLRPAKKLNCGIWITDELSAEYFHWFTDALTRLKAIEYARSSSDALHAWKNPFVVLPASYKEKHYISYSLELLNFKAHYYDPKQRLSVEKLTTCSHTAPTGNYNSEIINNLRDTFIKEVTHPVNGKIYISRSKAVKRKITNEEEVIHLLLQYNYEIHSFEDYNFERQIEIMSTTRTLIGLHGAGLTNMLFMPAQAKILELRNENDSHNNCYFSLASSLDHDYYYLTNKGDREDTNSVNITVDVTELRSVLALMETTQ